MNSKQRNLGYWVIIIIISMIMYPPMSKCHPHGRNCRQILNNYDWIFKQYDWSINFGLLFTQWIGVLIVGGILFFLFKDNKKIPKDGPW